MKLTSPAQITSLEPWRFLLYGEPGIGKTTFVSQAPRPVIIACPPNESLSLAKTDQALIPVLTVINWADAVQAVSYARKMKDVETVIFDTWSHLYEFALVEAMEMTKGKLSQATWSNANNLMRSLADELLTLRSKNVIIVSHQRNEKNDEGVITKVIPDFGEGLLRKLMGRLNAAFYYRKAGSGRELCTAMVTGVDTKSRYDLPDRMKNPTFKEVEEALNEYRERARKLYERSIEGNNGDPVRQGDNQVT